MKAFQSASISVNPWFKVSVCVNPWLECVSVFCSRFLLNELNKLNRLYEPHELNKLSPSVISTCQRVLKVLVYL